MEGGAAAQVRLPPIDPLVGELVAGRYLIGAQLGVGGMGAVYRAEQLGIGREVAVKVIRRSVAAKAEAGDEAVRAAGQEIRKRFDKEARLIGRLSHPAIVTLYDAGIDADLGLAYMAMELVHGRMLRDLFRAGDVDAVRLVEVCCDVLDALEVAHRDGVVHRDLKPENIMLPLLPTGAHSAKVLDFGIAKLIATDSSGLGITGPPGAGEAHHETPLTRPGMMNGTPRYMAPEQAQCGPIDGRTDLYAMGVILFEGLAGRAPFEDAQPVRLLYKHIRSPIPALPIAAKIDAALASVVYRALAKRREERFADAGQMAAALRQLLAEGRVAPNAADTVPDPGPGAGLNPEASAAATNAAPAPAPPVVRAITEVAPASPPAPASPTPPAAPGRAWYWETPAPQPILRPRGRGHWAGAAAIAMGLLAVACLSLTLRPQTPEPSPIVRTPDLVAIPAPPQAPVPAAVRAPVPAAARAPVPAAARAPVPAAAPAPAFQPARTVRDRAPASLSERTLREALTRYERHLEAHPRDVEALIGMGRAYAGLGHPHVALVKFDQALAIDPANAQALQGAAQSRRSLPP